MESRRFQGVAALAEGFKAATIARRLGVSRNSVYRWEIREREGQLKERKCSGRPCRLMPAQQAELRRIYPSMEGRKTAVRVSELILRQFGISYHPDGIPRVLQAAGIER